ncbi:G-type lectin S-receptor-like serine/threonine-protein kinase SD1-29 [Rosa chinensis]|uniref:G-type lectin S-receptor-like serine/threonine-protein kinase SD1-29 n=1 Tax=Rosa chinensis TaxID=74649 RepID=UPI001AD8BB1B|nr:G-type lectin S-receptor-like serine/threonine-protein kinase SD1-29 [Rosa chinensis]
MAARLASSLALADRKNSVDLHLSKGLRQPEAFMLGKLLMAREYSRRSFLGMFWATWRINGSLRVEEVGEDDGVLFTFTDPNDVDRVWKGGPWGYNTTPIALAPYDSVSPAVEVEDAVQFIVQFKYDKIFGRCCTCGLVTHVGLPCSGLELVEETDTPAGTVAPPTALAALREQLELPEPRQNENPITGLRRIREDDEVTISPKKLSLSLAIGKKNVDAVSMSLIEGPSNNNEQPKRKRGCPIGSVNKLPYATAGKGKNAKPDGESDKMKSQKTNLMPRLLVADETEQVLALTLRGKRRCLLKYGAEVYNITPSHPLAEGQTLVSPGQIFEMGFFSPNSSANKYLGLWHKNISPHKYVWVANRDNPLPATDTLATLRISSNGNLELMDGKQSSVWSANISNCSSAVLFDNGNFVVKDVMGADLWESFNNPSDTLLPSMLMGYNSGSGKRNFLTSWKRENDPSPGIFLIGLSTKFLAQAYIWINGSTPHWRSGPWDKSRFIGMPPSSNSLYLNPWTLDDNVTQGTRYLSYSFDKIPGHNLAYADISFEASESPICKCLKGFIPKSNEEWSKRNWTGGCLRRTKLSCETNANESVSSKGKDGFLKLERLKVPDFHEYSGSVALAKSEDCKLLCLSNCSCLAYAHVNNIGCLIWSKDLIDMQQFPSDGEDLYVRLARSELGERKPVKLTASLTVIGFLSIVVAIVFSLHRRRANQKRHLEVIAQGLESTSMIRNHRAGLREYIGKRDPSQLKIYDFDSILIATDNFSITNKLGQGGFGPVYKGMLPEGKEIVVKRLSSCSRQGVEEFKNEMLLISNLQHKNLVRMMGCCVKEDEKLLIYEFMPNKSLDSFLYDPTKRAVLNWATRFNIIQGIARRLIYHHHDSYVKVIHRDLKVSNILLDEKMNPKISDFGLARIVEETQSLENTQKVVGTCGYMSPEYAMGGIFSEKSDVYSFGVLVLEIISGKKNTNFCLYDQQLGFLAYTWKLWNEGKASDLVDEVLDDSYFSSEVMRCVHVGLLCVQDNAADRPTMVDVASILSSEKDGSLPKRPVFTIQNSVYHSGPYYENTNSSKNEASITMIEGR